MRSEQVFTRTAANTLLQRVNAPARSHKILIRIVTLFKIGHGEPLARYSTGFEIIRLILLSDRIKNIIERLSRTNNKTLDVWLIGMYPIY